MVNKITNTLTEAKPSVIHITRPVRRLRQNERLEESGKTATLLTINSRLSGILAMADTVKESAREAIDSLTNKMGIEVIMLTGDNERTANGITSKLDIDRVIAQVLPQQK